MRGDSRRAGILAAIRGDDGAMTSTNRLRGPVAVLAVVSLLAAVGAGVVSAVVMVGEDGSGEPSDGPTGLDHTAWTTVEGRAGAGDPATYQVPGGADWEIHDADFAVSYTGEDKRRYASGHAASFYYGNGCTDGSEKVAAGWAVFADTEQGSDLDAYAAESARRWARGYATGADGTQAPTTEPVLEDVELADGTPAVSAHVSLDMTVFEGPCLSDDAEVTVVSFETDEGIKALVAARYVGVTGGIPDEEYDAILASVEPD
jgi:hypothetical protein